LVVGEKIKMEPIEYLIFVIPALICAIPLGIFLYIQRISSKKIQVYIMRKIDKTYKIVKKIKIKNSDKELKYIDKLFMVDLSICIFDTNNRPILYYDYDNCEPISPFVSKVYRDPKTLKTFMEANIYPKIFGVDSSNFMMIILVIVVVASTVIGVYNIFMVSDMQNTLKTILSTIKPSIVIK